jgi:hypothetical protein
VGGATDVVVAAAAVVGMAVVATAVLGAAEVGATVVTADVVPTTPVVAGADEPSSPQATSVTARSTARTVGRMGSSTG